MVGLLFDAYLDQQASWGPIEEQNLQVCTQNLHNGLGEYLVLIYCREWIDKWYITPKKDVLSHGPNVLCHCATLGIPIINIFKKATYFPQFITTAKQLEKTGDFIVYFNLFG